MMKLFTFFDENKQITHCLEILGPPNLLKEMEENVDDIFWDKIREEIDRSYQMENINENMERNPYFSGNRSRKLLHQETRKKRMNQQIRSLEEYVKFFRKISDNDECDGDCDTNPPYKPCKECIARRVLNEIYEILKEADAQSEKNAVPSM
jgi:hypothetical protein